MIVAGPGGGFTLLIEPYGPGPGPPAAAEVLAMVYCLSEGTAHGFNTTFRLAGTCWRASSTFC
jgi:hypothetical protein